MEERDEDEDGGVLITGLVDWQERHWLVEVDAIDCDSGGVSAKGTLVEEDSPFRADGFSCPFPSFMA